MVRVLACLKADLVKIVPLPKIEEDPLAKHAVLLSKNDKAAQVILSEDRLTCRSEKGYRICRATHGVSKTREERVNDRSMNGWVDGWMGGESFFWGGADAVF